MSRALEGDRGAAGARGKYGNLVRPRHGRLFFSSLFPFFPTLATRFGVGVC